MKSKMKILWAMGMLLLFGMGANAQMHLQSAEYFTDSDPGVGNGVVMNVTDGSFDELWEHVDAVVNSLPLGNHRVNIRVQGVSGGWSPVFTVAVSVEQPLSSRNIKVVQAEFFVDSDPGSGNGNPLIVLDANFDEAFESALATAVSVVGTGSHTLNIRFQGVDGVWSNAFTSVIQVDSPASVRDLHLTAAELFWGADPGFGAGLPLLVSDGNFDEVLESVLGLSVAVPSLGSHVLNIRFLGLDGVWSNTISAVVNVENPAASRNLHLTQAEFFWDIDPGAGNAAPLMVVDGAFDEAIEGAIQSNISSPGAGAHTLGIRFVGLDGSWSNVFQTVISMEDPITSRDLHFTLFEMFFDTDPGFGFGTPLLAIDGNFDEVVERATGNVNSATLTPGSHVLNLRSLGLDGVWSNTFQSVVYVDPCTSSPSVSVTPSGPFSLCPGDSVLLNATPGLAAYSWYRNAQEIGNMESQWASQPGYYYAVGYDVDNCAGASLGVWIQGVATPTISVLPSGPTDLCPGASVTFTASGDFINFEWQDGATGAQFVASSAGNYSVFGTTSAGCKVYSDTLSVVAFSNPPMPLISADSPLEFCGNGIEQVTLSSSYPDGNLWSTGDSSASIVVQQSGDYWVSYTDVHGCSSTSLVVTAVALVPNVFYADVDGDGWGDPNNSIEVCGPAPLGYVDSNLDCHDDDPTVILCCPGDLNNDGTRDSADLLILLSVFDTGCGQPLCYGDFDGDAYSNTNDMLYFLVVFGTVCP